MRCTFKICFIKRWNLYLKVYIYTRTKFVGICLYSACYCDMIVAVCCPCPSRPHDHSSISTRSSWGSSSWRVISPRSLRTSLYPWYRPVSPCTTACVVTCYLLQPSLTTPSTSVICLRYGTLLQSSHCVTLTLSMSPIHSYLNLYQHQFLYK